MRILKMSATLLLAVVWCAGWGWVILCGIDAIPAHDSQVPIPAWEQAYRLREELDSADYGTKPQPLPCSDAQALARIRREVTETQRWKLAESEYIRLRQQAGMEIGHAYYITSEAYADRNQ